MRHIMTMDDNLKSSEKNSTSEKIHDSWFEMLLIENKELSQTNEKLRNGINLSALASGEMSMDTTESLASLNRDVQILKEQLKEKDREITKLKSSIQQLEHNQGKKSPKCGSSPPQTCCQNFRETLKRLQLQNITIWNVLTKFGGVLNDAGFLSIDELDDILHTIKKQFQTNKTTFKKCIPSAEIEKPSNDFDPRCCKGIDSPKSLEQDSLSLKAKGFLTNSNLNYDPEINTNYQKTQNSVSFLNRSSIKEVNASASEIFKITLPGESNFLRSLNYYMDDDRSNEGSDPEVINKSPLNCNIDINVLKENSCIAKALNFKNPEIDNSDSPTSPPQSNPQVLNYVYLKSRTPEKDNYESLTSPPPQNNSQVLISTYIKDRSPEKDNHESPTSRAPQNNPQVLNSASLKCRTPETDNYESPTSPPPQNNSRVLNTVSLKCRTPEKDNYDSFTSPPPQNNLQVLNSVPLMCRTLETDKYESPTSPPPQNNSQVLNSISLKCRTPEKDNYKSPTSPPQNNFQVLVSASLKCRTLEKDNYEPLGSPPPENNFQRLNDISLKCSSPQKDNHVLPMSSVQENSSESLISFPFKCRTSEKYKKCESSLSFPPENILSNSLSFNKESCKDDSYALFTPLRQKPSPEDLLYSQYAPYENNDVESLHNLSKALVKSENTSLHALDACNKIDSDSLKGVRKFPNLSYQAIEKLIEHQSICSSTNQQYSKSDSSKDFSQLLRVSSHVTEKRIVQQKTCNLKEKEHAESDSLKDSNKFSDCFDQSAQTSLKQQETCSLRKTNHSGNDSPGNTSRYLAAPPGVIEDLKKHMLFLKNFKRLELISPPSSPPNESLTKSRARNSAYSPNYPEHNKILVSNMQCKPPVLSEHHDSLNNNVKSCQATVAKNHGLVNPPESGKILKELFRNSVSIKQNQHCLESSVTLTNKTVNYNDSISTSYAEVPLHYISSESRRNTPEACPSPKLGYFKLDSRNHVQTQIKNLTTSKASLRKKSGDNAFYKSIPSRKQKIAHSSRKKIHCQCRKGSHMKTFRCCCSSNFKKRLSKQSKSNKMSSAVIPSLRMDDINLRYSIEDIDNLLAMSSKDVLTKAKSNKDNICVNMQSTVQMPASTDTESSNQNSNSVFGTDDVNLRASVEDIDNFSANSKVLAKVNSTKDSSCVNIQNTVKMPSSIFTESSTQNLSLVFASYFTNDRRKCKNKKRKNKSFSNSSSLDNIETESHFKNTPNFKICQDTPSKRKSTDRDEALPKKLKSHDIDNNPIQHVLAEIQKKQLVGKKVPETALMSLVTALSDSSLDASMCVFHIVRYILYSEEILSEENCFRSLSPLEECIVAALFEIERKQLSHLQNPLSSTVRALHQLILSGNFPIRRIMVLTRIFTKICERQQDMAAIQSFCYDLLKIQHRFAPTVIAIVANTWPQSLQVTTDMSSEKVMFFSALALGAKHKTRAMAMKHYLHSQDIISKVFNAPEILLTPSLVDFLLRRIEEIVGKIKKNKCVEEDKNDFLRTFILLFIHGDWNQTRNLLKTHILPNIKRYAANEPIEGVLYFYCNLYVDIFSQCPGKQRDEILTTYMKDGASLQKFVRDAVAIGLTKLYLLRGKQFLPPDVEAWCKQNASHPRLPILHFQQMTVANRSELVNQDIHIFL